MGVTASQQGDAIMVVLLESGGKRAARACIGRTADAPTTSRHSKRDKIPTIIQPPGL